MPLASKESGKHLLEVEDLLQKHGLLEADVAAQAERVGALNAAALKFTKLEGTGSGGGRGGLGQNWGTPGSHPTLGGQGGQASVSA